MSLPPLDPPRIPSVSGPPTQAQNTPGSYGEWYTLSLGGRLMPGKWKVTGGSVKVKYDPKKKPGVDGANPVFHGINPQPFDIEGEQFNDDERNALNTILSQILPQPGASQDKDPLLLQHPSVQVFGYAINVMILGCGIMEHTGVGTTKIKIQLQHWLQPKPNAKAAVKMPTQSVRNDRRNAAAIAAAKQAGQVNAAGNASANPPPTSQQGIAGPPQNFTPGQGS